MPSGSSLSSCVCFVLLFSFTAAAREPRVRPLDPIAVETLTRALEQSAVVSALVERLENSDVIVHVETSQSLPSDIGGTTRFVTNKGGNRYVRVSLNAHLRSVDRTPILAHELQHACEIAGSDATNVPGIRKLFERLGQRIQAMRELYETPAAVAVERRVRREIGRVGS